jgi:hypothetical protein
VNAKHFLHEQRMSIVGRALPSGSAAITSTLSEMKGRQIAFGHTFANNSLRWTDDPENVSQAKIRERGRV